MPLSIFQMKLFTSKLLTYAILFKERGFGEQIVAFGQAAKSKRVPRCLNSPIFSAIKCIFRAFAAFCPWLLCRHGVSLTVFQAIIHPDTNETIFMPFRMSGTVCPHWTSINFTVNLYNFCVCVCHVFQLYLVNI